MSRKLGAPHTSSTITGNYVDNCFIEWTNELDPTPAYSSGFSFSALSVTDNIFLSGDVAPWFSYLVVKPHGAGHFLNGLTVTGNKFRSINGNIDRVERVDTSFADLDFGRTKNVRFDANTYHSVDKQAANPLRVRHSEATVASSWSVSPNGELPFGGWARGVDSIVALEAIRDAQGSVQHMMPYVRTERGTEKDLVTLVWNVAVEGEVAVTLRIDR